jgi:rhodanese-related sulfurtransferase
MSWNADDLGRWAFPAAVGAFFVWRHYAARTARKRLPGLLARGAAVVDVRGPAEFAAGARPGSVNIPLSELPARLGELDRSKPVVLCCASGTRSALAAGILKSAGFGEVVNAGPWTNTLV